METNDGLRFSVIIPARNEEEYLQATLESVQSQITDAPYEIIVVDNGSVDNTAEVAKQAGVKVIHEPDPGLPRARESGRLIAKGEYLTYIDADTTMPVDYLSRVNAELQKHPDLIGVSNPFRFLDGSNAQNFLIFIYFHFFYRLQTIMLRLLGGSNQLIGGSFTVQAKTLEKAGGFNTDLKFFGEDTEISKRLGKYGKISFLYTLVAETSARRFKINGTFKTAYVYIRNYFSVALFNHESTHQTGRVWLKWLFAISVIMLAERFIFHLNHLVIVRAHTHNFRYWLALAEDHELILTTIILAILAMALYALISPAIMLFGTFINRMNTSEKLVALSFDDGPTPEATQRVLDILAQHDIPAIFFLIGERAERHPELVHKIAAAGHSVGIHAYQHRWLLPFRSKHYIASDLKRTKQILAKLVPVAKQCPQFYRPPHGWRTPWMLQAISESGYQAILWNIITLDYVEKYPAQKIVNKVVGHIKPGSIIVLHDGVAELPLAQRDNMIEALPQIIATLKSQGYQFVRLQDAA